MRYILFLALLLPAICWGQGATFEGIVNIPSQAVANSLTFTQIGQSSACTGAGTTCTVTVGSNIAAGDFLKLACQTTNEVLPTTITTVGTLIDSGVRTGRTQFFNSAFYILSANAFSAGNLTVTFNATPGATHCFLWDYGKTGSGLGLDSTADWSSNASTTSLTQIANILTGTTGLALEESSASTNPTHCTGVSGTGWAHSTAPNDETGGCAGAAVGLSVSPNTPTLAFSGSNEASLENTVFSFNPTAAVQYCIEDFSASSNGTHPAADSQVTLYGGLHGCTGLNQSTNGVTVLAISDTQNALTYNSTTTENVATLPRLLNSGKTYTVPGTPLSAAWSSTTGTGHIGEFNFTFPGNAADFGSPSYVASAWIQLGTGFLVTDTFNMDVITMNALSGDLASVAVSANGTHINATLEVKAGCTGGSGNIQLDALIGQWLEYDVFYENGVEAELDIYQANGTHVGNLTYVPGGSCALTGQPASLSYGAALNGTTTAGRTIYFGPLKVGYSGNFTGEVRM